MDRTGGAYVPPARLRQQTKGLNDGATSEAFQRLTWDALKKSINGLVNKANTSNLATVSRELFGENLLRGRGLLVKAVMRAQSQALPFTAVYSALLSILNSRIPQIGELLVKRLILTFRKAYKRNDKPLCLASTMFLAHLVNHRVAHEIIVLQILTLLLETPTEDSVEVSVGFVRECGAFLVENAPRALNAVFERFRAILHEGSIDKRVQYMLEVLFEVRKDGFSEHLAVPVEFVSEDEQITHGISLDDELDAEDQLNVFVFDPEFDKHEAEYEEVKAEILAIKASEIDEEETAKVEEAPSPTAVTDMTGTNLMNLRRTIYLTIMSSADFEECGHKLLKLSLPIGAEQELCNMIVECCSQERTYLKFYGLLAERFCRLNILWQEGFERAFKEIYANIHRLETPKIRNIANLYAHLLETNVVKWTALFAGIKLFESTSASRVLLKLLFQTCAELCGRQELLRAISFPAHHEALLGLFPDDPEELTFCIKFWEAIGLNELVDYLERRHKK